MQCLTEPHQAVVRQLKTPIVVIRTIPVVSSSLLERQQMDLQTIAQQQLARQGWMHIDCDREKVAPKDLDLQEYTETQVEQARVQYLARPE